MKITDDWLDKALEDDEELVISMLQLPIDESICVNAGDQLSEHEQPGDSSDSASNLSEHGCANSASDKNEHEQAIDNSGSDSHNEHGEHEKLMNIKQHPDLSNASICENSSVSVYCNMLKQYAKQHDHLVHDIPGDGDCLFSSVAYQLQRVGHNINKSSLRQMVADYLSEHADFYSAFVHQPVNSSDDMNADNEPIDDEDVYIESLYDPVVQHELRWQKYLRRMRKGAWGDNIAIAAICDLFDACINVIWARQAGTSIVKNSHCLTDGKNLLNIGLILQFHFVGLDKLDSADKAKSSDDATR